MVKKITSLAPFLIIIALSIALPVFAAGLVPCGGSGESPCTICDLAVLIKNILNFMFQMAFTLATLFIVYGGFVIMTAAGNEKNVTEGKNILTAAIIGIAIALTAWLVINTIFTFLTDPNVVRQQWNVLDCPLKK